MLSLSNSTHAGESWFDRRSSIMPRMAHEQAEMLAQKKGASASERFLVKPDYAYPNIRMNRDELRKEMNEPSAVFHDLRLPSRKGEEIGLLKLEILQCFGLPKLDALSDNCDAFCLSVCGSYAFKTDIMPPVANPMWLSKMRRACIFPLFNAYARLYIGVFDDDGQGERDDFAGRIVLDIARMRPGCTYDVTLPLRESAHVYMRRPRGAIRVRFHISWYSEQAAMLSYIPKQIPKIEPNESVTVNCCDQKSFQNTALTVHGTHPPGRFSMKVVKALIREINFTRIHILRYMRKRELRNLVGWKNPIISGFLFVSWMHSVYINTVRYVPGNLITFLLLYLWKNYANYAINDSLQRGFLPPTWEEMFLALLYGTEGRHYIQPLEMTPNNPSEERTPIQSMGDESVRCSESTTLEAVAVAFKKGVKVSNHHYRLRTYMNTFVGSEGVDFLVNNGYAMSREEAVKLGCQMAEKMKLFEHVARKHEFKDAHLFYHFLIVDDKNYTLMTHKPRGKSFFRMLRLLDEDMNVAENQLEMPYSSGPDHPRFTVKESLLVRSKESKTMIKKLMAHEGEDDDDATELGMESPMGLNASEASFKLDRLNSYLDLKHSPSAKVPEGPSPSMELPEEEEMQEDETIVTVKQLKKPPIQDIDFKMVSDKPITDVLAEARHKIHGILLHCFNDRTYVIRDEALSHSRRKSKSSSWKKVVNSLSRRNKSQQSLDAIPESQDGNRPASPGRSAKSLRSYSSDQTSVASLSSEQNGGMNKSQRKNSKSDIAAAKEENDKLLKIGIYSNSNRWVAKVGVIVQPIVEIAYAWLYLFRALFNIFTWRDPILSFWVSIIGPIVVIVLHLFPWRAVFAVTGVLLWGPQNWLFRVIAEKKGIHPPDMDKIIKKGKKKTGDDEPELKEAPLFCNDTDDNQPVDYAALDQSNVRHIVVPYSPLMYNHRFYDWPPEPEYARVSKEDPQSKARIDFVPSVLDDAESVYTLHSEDGGSSNNRKDRRNWRKEFSSRRFKRKQT